MRARAPLTAPFRRILHWVLDLPQPRVLQIPQVPDVIEGARQNGFGRDALRHGAIQEVAPMHPLGKAWPTARCGQRRRGSLPWLRPTAAVR